MAEREHYYTAKGKKVGQLLDDYEKQRMDASQKGNTVDYLHAALMARAAQEQRFWAIVGAVSRRLPQRCDSAGRPPGRREALRACQPLVNERSWTGGHWALPATVLVAQNACKCRTPRHWLT